MQIVYNGPHPEVVVDELDSEHVITAGEPTEIPDDLAARLLEQATWSLPVAGQTRNDLNEQAAAAGVEDPHKLPSKQAVVDAIQAATVTTTDASTDPASATDATTKGDS